MRDPSVLFGLILSAAFFQLQANEFFEPMESRLAGGCDWGCWAPLPAGVALY